MDVSDDVRGNIGLSVGESKALENDPDLLLLTLAFLIEADLLSVPALY